MNFNDFNTLTQTAGPAFTSGGTLTPPWNSIQFSDGGTKPWDFVSQITGPNYVGPVCTLQSLPMLPNHRAPLNFNNGTYTITYNAGAGTPNATLQFVIGPSVKAKLGWNLNAASGPESSPVTHPPLNQLCIDTSASVVRVWGELETWQNNRAGYFDICDQWRSLGRKVLFQLQYPTGSPYPTSTFAPFVQQAAKHVDFICVANEANTLTYWKAGIPALVQQTNYVVDLVAGLVPTVAPSFLNSLPSAKAFAASGGYAKVQALDFHSYHATPSDVIAELQQYVAFAQQEDSDAVFISEWGTRPYQTTNQQPAAFPPATWAANQVQVIQAMASQAVTMIPYPAFPLESLDLAYPLNAAYAKNEPYYSSYSGGMK